MKKKILLVADGVTTAHITRMEQLALQIDQSQFEIHFAAPKNYFQLLSIQELGEVRLYPIQSLATLEFNQKLYLAQFPWTHDQLSHQLKEDLELLLLVKPDLVIGDTRLSLPVACAQNKIPFFNLINFHWNPNYQRPNLVPHMIVVNILGRRIAESIAPFITPLVLKSQVRYVNKWLTQIKADSVRTIFDFYCLGDYLLFPDLPSFFKGHEIPVNGSFLGPLIWKSKKIKWPTDWNEVKKGKAKYVMLSMGSSGNTDLIPQIVEVLNDLEFEVLMSGNSHNLKDSKKYKVHQASFFPMDEVLKICDLSVGNGGTMSTYHFISKAQSFFSIPNNLDQYLSVDHLRNIKISDHMDLSQFSSDLFREKLIATISSNEIRQNLNQAKTEIEKILELNPINSILNSKL